MDLHQSIEPQGVYRRLVEAQNAHDLDAMLGCFDPGYRSEQPAHPARAFTGIEQVRKNWVAMLTAVPDFSVEVLRIASTPDTVWAEARWSGTKADGTPLEEMIVMILGVEEGRIVWARLYGEEVERDGPDIDETVRRLAGTEPDPSGHQAR
jgi:ketosteroid isomerase-like protein